MHEMISFLAIENIEFCYLLTLLASGHVCSLLIAFANSLDPDQDRQNVGPDLDSNRLTP